MASPFDKMKNDQKPSGEELVKHRHLKPLSLPKKDQDDARGDVHISLLRDFQESSTPASAPKGTVDDMTTLSDLPTVRTPSLSFNSRMPDGLSIDKQETWTIPAAPPPTRKGIPAPQAKDSEMIGYTSQLRQLARRSGIYALASVVSPLISLVLAPFLTHNLSRTDYGLLAVLTTAIALVAGVTQLGLGSAFFRSYNYDYESQHDKLGVLSTVLILLSLSSILAALIIVIGAPLLATHLLGSPSSTDLVRLTGLIVLIQNLTVPGFAWLRAENRAGFFSLLSIVNLLITLFFTIVLVGKMQMGISGVLLASGAGSVVVVICTIPLILLRAGIGLRVDIARGLLAFGLPLVPNFISYWVLQLSDRYLLSIFGSFAQTASYAVAYTLGSAIAIVVIGPFTLAWPTAMFTIAKRDDAARIFGLVFRWFGLFLLFTAYGLSLAGIVLLNWLFPVTYHSTAIIIPIVAASITFYGIYNLFTVGVNIKRKTWVIAIYTTAAAIVNIVLNLVLIRFYGALGAAVSTFLAYLVLASIAYVVNQRIYPVSFEIGIFLVALLIGSALFVGSSYLTRLQGTYRDWGIDLATLSLYAGILILLGKLPTWKDKLKYRDMREKPIT